jgi:hypothetical protein
VIRWLLRLSIGLTTGVLALAYALSGLWVAAVVAILLGLLWLALDGQRWSWLASVGLILCVGLAALGFTQRLPPWMLLVGLLAVLTAWDLDDFQSVLESEASVQGAATMQRNHLQRLLVVDLLGLALGLVALQVRTRLTLGVALLLGLLAVLGLSRAIGFLRRESD